MPHASTTAPLCGSSSRSARQKGGRLVRLPLYNYSHESALSPSHHITTIRMPPLSGFQMLPHDPRTNRHSVPRRGPRLVPDWQPHWNSTRIRLQLLQDWQVFLCCMDSVSAQSSPLILTSHCTSQRATSNILHLTSYKVRFHPTSYILQFACDIVHFVSRCNISYLTSRRTSPRATQATAPSSMLAPSLMRINSTSWIRPAAARRKRTRSV